MADEKPTKPVVAGRDKDKDSGPVVYDARNGKLTVKIGVIVGLFSMLSLGGGYVGIRTTAPDPEVVKATAKDVGEIKEAIVKLGSAIESLAKDRDSLERRIDTQQRDIERLRESMPTAREMDDLRARVKRLEDERGK